MNSVPLAQARAWAGDLPAEVTWRDVTDELAAEVAGYIDGGATEGTAWKLAPLRAFPDRHELVLDNDCVLWREPPAIAVWRFSQEACLLAADLRPCFGQFARWCGRQALNAGIRGLPPSFDFGAAVRRVLTGHPVALRSEVDEQGLVVAALSTPGPPIVVPLDDVTICSPLSMHQHHLGRCGAHFVGVNGQRSMWRMDGRPLHEHFHRHWHTHRAAVRDLVGLGLRPRE